MNIRFILERICVGLVYLALFGIIFYPVLIPIILAVLIFFSCILFVVNSRPENRRLNALAQARLFLSPYTNIWNDLKLTNRNCSVELTKRKEIIIRDSNNPNVIYKINRLKRNAHWDRLCFNFNLYTETINVTTFFLSLNYRIAAINDEPSNSESKRRSQENDGASMPVLKLNNENSGTNVNKNRVDINNASEIEITSLPGISIVLSKKLIQRREEIDGFKDVQEVFDFLNIKPHFEKQLENLICVNKMQGKIKIKKFKERRIDI